MKQLLGTFFLFFLVIANAQHRMVPIGASFKDITFAPTSAQLTGPAVFPLSEKDAPIYSVLQDTQKRYSIVGYYLYQRELIEVKDKKTKLWITPLFDISYGLELEDTNQKRYQNTRGARLEGLLGKHIFFTTSFYENQALLPSYVRDYIQQRGEAYLNSADSSYVISNAVVPGAARTKPFKETGFDYGYATGMMSLFATSKLTVHWGNMPLFVGSGHRSMLWSDNSVGAMNLRVRYQFNKKWDLQMVRARGLNLLRRQEASNGEAYYEPKSLSFTTLYFQPVESFSIGIFEGGVWNRGDSISQRPIQALYFVPLPGSATAQQSIDKTSALAVLGLDFKWNVFNQVIYGQFAASNGKQLGLAYQLGVRLYPTENPFFQIQLEYNHADATTYSSNTSRVNYSNYNLPIAHPMAAGFDELIIRFTGEKKHFFTTIQANIYFNQNANWSQLLPANTNTFYSNNQVLNVVLEAGYRFNRTYGFELFGAFRYRYSDRVGFDTRTWISAGLRMNLTNHYFDF